MYYRKIIRLPKEKTLTLLIGIPAVGKTFLANKMKIVNSYKRVIISSDEIRRNILRSKETKIYFDQGKEGEIWDIIEKKVYEQLINTDVKECVLDAVNLKYFSRHIFIHMAKELKIKTKGIVIYRSLKKIMKWNINRKYPVSESLILQFFKHFEPPLQDEFDILIKIGSFRKFQKERKKFKSLT